MGRVFTPYVDDQWAGEGTVVARGRAAMLVDVEGEEGWVPYSQIGDDSELGETAKMEAVGELIIPLWLAIKNGWH